MPRTKIDFEEDSGSVPQTEDAARRITKLAKEQLRIEGEIAALEEQMSVKNDELKRVSEDRLPALLQELGIEKMTLETGEEVALKKTIHASLSKERAPAGIAWLVSHKHGGIVKSAVTASFEAGQIKEAKKLATVIKKAGFEPTVAQTVHPQTLGAFVREQIAKGTAIPLDIFGVHESMKATVKNKKEN